MPTYDREKEKQDLQAKMTFLNQKLKGTANYQHLIHKAGIATYSAQNATVKH